MNRLPKLIGAIIIFLLLCVFFAVYFFKYIPAQQQLLNGRAFRELEQIGNGLTNKNDAYTTAIHSYLKRRSTANPIRHYFRLTNPFPLDTAGKVSYTTGPAQLEKNTRNGNWQLSYPVYTSSDTQQQHTPVTSMYTGLAPVLQPIIATYRDIFDGYLVFKDHLNGSGQQPLTHSDSLYHYEVAFSSGTLPDDYRVSLDSLMKTGDGFNLITVHDITIEGTAYKLFLYPIQLGKERIVLAGTITLSAYRKGYNTLPFSLTVQVAVLVLLLLIHLPILKIYVLGNCERIRSFDIRTIIGTYFLAAFLTFFLFSRLFLNHVQSMHNFHRLKDLSTQVENSFTTEIDQVCRQLRQWDTSTAIWGRDSAALYRLINHDTTMRRHNWNKQTGSTDSLLIDSLFRLPPYTYPYADYVYWIDSSGSWVATWNTKREFNKSDLLVVRDRSYFQDFMQNNLLILPGIHPPDSFTLQPTLSRLDGEYTINIVTRSRPIPGRKSHLVGLSTEMYSVCDPILPSGYNFSIVDAQGNILYDSKAGRALLSNIAKETESPSDILAPLRYHSKRYFSSFILQGRLCPARIRRPGRLGRLPGTSHLAARRLWCSRPVAPYPFRFYKRMVRKKTRYPPYTRSPFRMVATHTSQKAVLPPFLPVHVGFGRPVRRHLDHL